MTIGMRLLRIKRYEVAWSSLLSVLASVIMKHMTSAQNWTAVPPPPFSVRVDSLQSVLSVPAQDYLLLVVSFQVTRARFWAGDYISFQT
jgi:hypothetical protein